MQITDNDVLGWLAHGMSEEEILEEHPGLEKQDFAAVYTIAAELTDQVYRHTHFTQARSTLKRFTSQGEHQEREHQLRQAMRWLSENK